MNHLMIESLQQSAEFEWHIQKQLYGVWSVLKKYPDLNNCQIIDLFHVSMVLFELSNLPLIIQAGIEILHKSGIQSSDPHAMQIQLARMYVEKHHPGAFARLHQQSMHLPDLEKQQFYNDWMKGLQFDWAGELKGWLSSQSLPPGDVIAVFCLLSMRTDRRAKQYVNEFPAAINNIQSRFTRWENYVIPA